MRNTGGATIVKLRAMVSGSGDLRRVPSIVSEMFTEKKLPLPVVSTVQVGSLPMEGAQVVIESIAMARKEVNTHGVVWISGQQQTSDKPLDPTEPLARKSMADLKTALSGAGSQPLDALQVNEIRGMLAREFQTAALNLVQVQRSPSRAVVECEAVARLRQPLAESVRMVNPQGLPSSPNYSQLAVISAPKVVFTGLSVSYGYQDADARLAFQRLDRVLKEAGASIKNVAMSSVYPLSASLGEQVRKIRFDFYDKARPPASTMLPFEGLPAMEAGFAVEVVAVVQ
jgi:enamine deaminase RidA (YjgF/YER057c/UK114 family)